ncbi:MAG: ADP-forming succinate--CoA ligase subunit beta [Gemmatimonadota bacterium]
MNIHEYQAKEILRSHGIPVPPGGVARSPEEAEAVARGYSGDVVVKAQVHASGRGKAGGVKVVKTPEAAGGAAASILGMRIKDLEVRAVLVTPAADIASEAYVGIVLDRRTQTPVLMVSGEGGIDIEEVAATKPEAIHRLSIDPRYGLLPHQAAAMGYRLYDDPGQAKQAGEIIGRLWRAYEASDATLVEINPLIVTCEGEVLAIDAKMNIDDNALFRLPEIAEMRDEAAEAASERKARTSGLSYIKLDGSVACCVNGAGLAMATMDLVKHYGGSPANFLDIGGSSNPDKVVSALEIITSDRNVRAILFNIFGGITRCDDVANGIVEAMRRIDIPLPIVIRLTGTNEEEAVRILSERGLQAMTDMDEAVKRAVEAAA